MTHQINLRTELSLNFVQAKQDISRLQKERNCKMPQEAKTTTK